jgi:hypothetical protein
VFGRFDLAALAQPHLKFLFVCLFKPSHQPHPHLQLIREGAHHATITQPHYSQEKGLDMY